MQVAAVNTSPPLDALRTTFDRFVGETFYGQMLGAMRKTTGKAPYFHGGRAEEIFQGQFDQVIAEKLSESNANSFTGPMFRQFLSQTKPAAAAQLSSKYVSTPLNTASEQSPPWEGLLAAQRR